MLRMNYPASSGLHSILYSFEMQLKILILYVITHTHMQPLTNHFSDVSLRGNGFFWCVLCFGS